MISSTETSRVRPAFLWWSTMRRLAIVVSQAGTLPRLLSNELRFRHAEMKTFCVISAAWPGSPTERSARV
ncbi:MAG: hypothetical protein V9E98_14500 [Candidatus Nanopelagicales bacterium]